MTLQVTGQLSGSDHFDHYDITPITSITRSWTRLVDSSNLTNTETAGVPSVVTVQLCVLALTTVWSCMKTIFLSPNNTWEIY